MKLVVLILSFFLSVFSGGRGDVSGQYEEGPSSVVETTGSDKSEGAPDYYTQAILPVQTARFSGDGSSVTPSVRSTNSGRRTQVSPKFPFRITKAGKTIDRRHFFIFQEELHQFQTGIHSTSRYIHSICHLLI